MGREPASFTINLGGCRCRVVSLWGEPANTVFLVHSLVTKKEYRQQGAAKRVLRAIRKWAQKNKVVVTLDAAPFDDRPLEIERLECFYMTMGFRTVERHGNRWSRKMVFDGR